MTRLETRSCVECDCVYDVLDHNGVFLGMDRDDGQVLCPACDRHAYRLPVVVPRAIDTGDVAGAGRNYPYFDRNLGMQINSKRHRAQVCKAHGLVPADSVVDTAKAASASETKKATYRARYAALQKRYETDSNFADYREMRSKGGFKSPKEH